MVRGMFRQLGMAGIYRKRKSTGLLPVSYTHLDVYKRQTYFSKGRISETATEWTECCGNRGTVSYTHLVLKIIQTGAGMGWIIILAILVILGYGMVLMSVTMPRFKLMQKLVDKINLVSREILT